MKKCIIFFGLFILHAANATLESVSFPKTYGDMSFQDRMLNETEGYTPFMDKSAYTELNIAPGEEFYTDRMIAQIENNETNISDDVDYINPQVGNYITTNANYNGDFKTIGGGQVIINNFVSGFSCFPPDMDRHFVNKILTTGKYEHISPAFEKAMITIFRKEGNCGTIKNDPCGYTCFGIGSSPQCAGVIIETRSEAEDWYYRNFWQKYNIDKLPDVISGDFFLAAMASGPVTAYNQLRQFLGLSSSKKIVIDSDLIYAINNYKGDIHNKWLDKRDAFLQNVAQKRYGGTVSKGYKNAIELKRKNGCHVIPQQPLYR